MALRLPREILKTLDEDEVDFILDLHNVTKYVDNKDDRSLIFIYSKETPSNKNKCDVLFYNNDNGDLINDNIVNLIVSLLSNDYKTYSVILSTVLYYIKNNTDVDKRKFKEILTKYTNEL